MILNLKQAPFELKVVVDVPLVIQVVSYAIEYFRIENSDISPSYVFLNTELFESLKREVRLTALNYRSIQEFENRSIVFRGVLICSSPELKFDKVVIN